MRDGHNNDANASRLQYPSRARLHLEQPPTQAVWMDEVREGLLAVDGDDRDPLSIGSLELGVLVDLDLDEVERDLFADRGNHPLRARAEVAALREVDRHLVHGALKGRS